MIYQIVKSIHNEDVLIRFNSNETVSVIPFDEANADYQQYLVWLSEQPKAK